MRKFGEKKNYSRQINSKCKSPEAGISLSFSMSSKTDKVTEVGVSEAMLFEMMWMTWAKTISCWPCRARKGVWDIF